jgi:Flp pilus assembly protein TadG
MSNNPDAGFDRSGKQDVARRAAVGRLSRSRQRTRGAAILELSLMVPWIAFLFVGALDWGFYAYELITVETATRSAAVYESGLGSIDSAGACTIVLDEMSTLTNMASVSACGSNPLVVSATQVTGPDNNNAAQVSVTYTTPQMIPIPGLLANRFTITRTVQIRKTS